MAAGYKDFTAGSVLTAADLEDYNQNQSIMRFASAAARDSALTTVKTEGMCAYLIDSNTVTVYSGSAWSTFGPVHGAGITWTPTVTQSGSVTVTNNNSVYWRVGRLVTAHFYVTVTGSGSASNAVVIGALPVTAASNVTAIGVGDIYDSSATTAYGGRARMATTTTFNLYADVGSVLGLSGSFTAGLANGDILSGMVSYPAAGDA